MNIKEWCSELHPEEQGYVRQSFRSINGTNGAIQPDPPAGMSKAKADILFYHTKSFIDLSKGRKRKMDEWKVISFRGPAELEKSLAIEAAQLDINKSIYIRACIEMGRPMVKEYPKLITFLSDEVIPR